MYDFVQSLVQFAISPSYYGGTDVVIIVYDITDRESFEAIPYWINELKTNSPYLAPPDVIVAIVGNKIDLETKRIVQKDTVESYLKDLKESGFPKYLIHRECSAKTGKDVHHLFEEICEIIVLKALGDSEEERITKFKENRVKTKRAWSLLFGYKDGKRDEKKAMIILEGQVKNEDNEAMWILGLCKEYGIGIEQDIKGAEKLYKQSSEHGNEIGKFLASNKHERGTLIISDSLY